MKRPRRRMRRKVLYFDAESERRLLERAAAHGVSPGQYVRDWLNDRRPGAEPGSEVAQADAWYDSRPPGRRVSIWKNHAAPKGVDPIPADQLCIDLDGSHK